MQWNVHPLKDKQLGFSWKGALISPVNFCGKRVSGRERFHIKSCLLSEDSGNLILKPQCWPADICGYPRSWMVAQGC